MDTAGTLSFGNHPLDARHKWNSAVSEVQQGGYQAPHIELLSYSTRRTRKTEIQGRCGFGLQRNVQRSGRKEKNRYILMLKQSLWWSKEIENNQWQGVMKG